MSRIASVAVVGLAVGLLTAPLAFAQGAMTEAKPQVAQAQMAAPTPAAKAKSTTARHMPAMPPVDLNTADRDELMKLAGIGDVTADKIIAARPFKSKSELLSKGLVTKAQYGKFSKHVIAKQALASK